MTGKADSKELEDLFDSVAADAQKNNSKRETKKASVGDSQELEDLFDSIASQSSQENIPNEVEVDLDSNDEMSEEDRKKRVFNRVGSMVRALHDTLGELRTTDNKSVGRILEKAVANSLPDTQDRLTYIATLTEQAANKVLNATDVISPLVEELGDKSRSLSGRWDKVFSNQMSTADFKDLALETREFLKHEAQQKLGSTHNQVTEIMMAQDFQDLTGQVIKKIIAVMQEMENGLMSVLLDVTPDEKRSDKFKEIDDKLHGPIINPEGRKDVVVNQAEVDDLLDSLGF